MPLYPGNIAHTDTAQTFTDTQTIAPGTDVPSLVIQAPASLSGNTAIQLKAVGGTPVFEVSGTGSVTAGGMTIPSIGVTNLYDAATGSIVWANYDGSGPGVVALPLPADLAEQAAPSSPAAGSLRLYAKTDHTLHVKDSTGTDTALGAGGGGSTIHTDAYSTGSDPSSPANGDWWYPSNGGGIYAARISAAWVWYYKGFPIYLPTTSGWSWNNQRSTTVSTTGGTIYLHAPADSTDSWSMYLRTLPSTPYSLVAYVEPVLSGQNYNGAGIPLRKSSDGSWIAFVQYLNSNSIRHDVATGSSGNAITAATFDTPATKVWPWLKITDDGTTRKYYFGDDGQHWEILYSHAHTGITTPDTYGLGIESRSAADVGIRLVSLKEYNSVI